MTQMPQVRIERLAAVNEEALAILEEYYEAVQVVVRDTPQAIQKMLDEPASGMWLAYAGDAHARAKCWPGEVPVGAVPDGRDAAPDALRCAIERHRGCGPNASGSTCGRRRVGITLQTG